MKYFYILIEIVQIFLNVLKFSKIFVIFFRIS